MHVHRTIAVDAPPDVVWRCITDAALRPRWMQQLVSEEIDDPDRRGVGGTATVKVRQNGKVVTYRSTVLEWEDGRVLAVGLTGGELPPDVAMGARYELAAGDAPDTTVLRYDFQFPLTSLMLKLLSPLIRIGATKVIDGDLTALRALAESMRER